MRFLRQLAFVLVFMLLAPSVAQAHLVNTGMGPFFDGAMHLALSPDDLLGLLAAAMLAGLRVPEAGRWTLAILPLTWLLGATVGLFVPGIPTLAGLSILSFMVLGLLVAMDAKLPTWSVSTLAGVFGLLHGLLNGAALFQADAGMLNVLGIVTFVFILLLLISAAVVALRPAWTRIAVRVAGSWVVAVGMLIIGWLYRAGV